MKLLTKRVFLTIVVSLFVILIAGWYLFRSEGNGVSYKTTPLKRGDILVTISATGTVEPEDVINVGAQVAGKIISFGKDKDGNTIDYASVVEEGVVMAKIDDTVYIEEVAQCSAQLLQAKAGVLRAEADLVQLKAKLYQAQRDWERAQKLGPSEALAESTYDSYKSAYETAKAGVAIGEATIEQDKASVAQTEAALKGANRNLDYCTIKSPINGIVIDRRVNIGQTVVASLSAPSLFLIAKDLKRMQVWVSVNEMDIGSIRSGQAVSFTVDAYPDEVFRGTVRKVRLNATMSQNVVTYIVEVVTDNSSGKLLPYLTANVQFELNSRKNVLLLPNAALKWTPQAGQVAAEHQSILVSDANRNGNAAANGHSSSNSTAASEASSMSVIWILDGNYVRPIQVRAGLSDKTMTEVEGDELKKGMEVVIGEQQTTTTADNTTNPFIPKMRRSTTTTKK